MQSPCFLCVCESPWTNFYETWYDFHGTWAHLNGVLYKSLPSVCVSLFKLLGNGSVKLNPSIIAMQRIGKHVPEAKNTRNVSRIVESMCLFSSSNCPCLSV
jgi:hypothetical protein